MIRMGIDASTNCTGYCIFKKDKLVTYGKLKLSNKEKTTFTPIEKIFWMGQKIEEIIQNYNPEILCVERAVPTKVNLNTTESLMRLNGVILYVALLNKVKEIEFIEVSRWRKLVGLLGKGTEGRDHKKELSIKKANQLYDLNLIYKSPDSVYNDDDISDAILVCHYVIHKDDRGFGNKQT